MNRRRSTKPHYILLRCVKSGGPFVMGETYYATNWQRMGIHETTFDVCVDGEVRVATDDRFTPLNPRNWWLFSAAQRLRFNVPQASDRFWSRLAA